MGPIVVLDTFADCVWLYLGITMLLILLVLFIIMVIILGRAIILELIEKLDNWRESRKKKKWRGN